AAQRRQEAATMTPTKATQVRPGTTNAGDAGGDAPGPEGQHAVGPGSRVDDRGTAPADLQRRGRMCPVSAPRPRVDPPVPPVPGAGVIQPAGAPQSLELDPPTGGTRVVSVGGGPRATAQTRAEMEGRRVHHADFERSRALGGQYDS